MRAFKVIFWDFDGVIKDSASIKMEAFSKLFFHYGRDVTDRIRTHQSVNGGTSRYEKFPIYLKWAGQEITSDRVDELCSKFSEIVFKDVISSEWVPGIQEYLLSNYRRQIFILVTATPLGEINRILDALGIANLFQGIHGSPQKKDEVLADALSRFGCSPMDALMVGDSYADLSAAQANKVRFLLRRTRENQYLIDKYSIEYVDNFLHIKGFSNE